MRNEEFKHIDLKILTDDQKHLSHGTCDRYQGDPRAYAATILFEDVLRKWPLDAECALIQLHHHKVGRKWTATKTELGRWNIRDLVPDGEKIQEARFAKQLARTA
jgi:hypothetical protein